MRVGNFDYCLVPPTYDFRPVDPKILRYFWNNHKNCMMAPEEKLFFCGVMCRYRLSAMIIGLIESLALLMYFASSVYIFVESKITANCVFTSGSIQYANKCNGYRIYRYLTTHPMTFLSISFVLCSIGWVAVGLMIRGLRTTRSRLLLPHLASQTVAVFGFAAAVVLFSIRAASVGIEESTRAQAESTADVDAHHVDPILREAMVMDVTLVVLMLVIWMSNLYFLVVIYRCYHYLKDIKASSRVDSLRNESVERSSSSGTVR